MRRGIACVLAVAAAQGVPLPVRAQDKTAFPSHCRADEFAFVNARMGVNETRPDGSRVTRANGKVLSLCADQPREPVGRLTYRYGPPGAVELEQSATPAARFGHYARGTSPHTGEQMLFFTRGAHTYYVVVANGQARGVSLHVFARGKQVVDLFSGTEFGSDYEIGPLFIAFDKPMSPVLAHMRPRDAF